MDRLPRCRPAFSRLAAAICVLHPALATDADAHSLYLHFEGRQTHSLALSPDGRHLLALNTPDGRLSVFDVSNPTNPAPVLVSEIAVGLEPVSLRAFSNEEVWVVNEVSDSVSVVSIPAAAVVETLRAPDEPADVVFARDRAFVTCARSNQIRVFDPQTRSEIKVIELQGVFPRALAVDEAGDHVYVAIHLSGNGTTVLPAEEAPPQPPPDNAALPDPPATALIVRADDPRVAFTVSDNDVAEIAVETASVTRYFQGVGTNLFDLAVRPRSGEIWVANTEARNLVRFEPALRGHVADHRLTRIRLSDGEITPFDLNDGLDYSAPPNAGTQDQALAQPTAIIFSADGSVGWVAACGSDRLAKINAEGVVLERVDLRVTPPRHLAFLNPLMRGPRALALDESRSRLFVLNRVCNTITTVNTETNAVLSEVPVGGFDPTPDYIIQGRRMVYDARLSSHGTVACATCHIDGDRDGLAWDMGDPGGQMVQVIGANLFQSNTTPQLRNLHPMKGPMVTQSLRGLADGPFQWRGDRATIEKLSARFSTLLGGPTRPLADILALRNYLYALRHHPNPHRKTDGTLPDEVAGGNPELGRQKFLQRTNGCAICHALPTGSDNNIDDPQFASVTDFVKTPPLRTFYQKTLINRGPGSVSLTGFGYNHDGASAALPVPHTPDIGDLAPEDFPHVTAFLLCFDTGTAPAVGYTRTVTDENKALRAVRDDLALLESQAAAAAIDLIVRGRLEGRLSSLYYDPLVQEYRRDSSSLALLTRPALLAKVAAGDALSFMGVVPLDGPRWGSDRDDDFVLDGDENLPPLSLAHEAQQVSVLWPHSATGWVLEENHDLLAPAWETVTRSRVSNATHVGVHEAVLTPAKFYRLKRTW